MSILSISHHAVATHVQYLKNCQLQENYQQNNKYFCQYFYDRAEIFGKCRHPIQVEVVNDLKVPLA